MIKKIMADHPVLKNARNEKDVKLIHIMMYNKECLKEDSDKGDKGKDMDIGDKGKDSDSGKDIDSEQHGTCNVCSSEGKFIGKKGDEWTCWQTGDRAQMLPGDAVTGRLRAAQARRDDVNINHVVGPHETGCGFGRHFRLQRGWQLRCHGLSMRSIKMRRISGDSRHRSSHYGYGRLSGARHGRVPGDTAQGAGSQLPSLRAPGWDICDSRSAGVGDAATTF